MAARRLSQSLGRKRTSHEYVASFHISTIPIFCPLALLCSRSLDNGRTAFFNLSSWSVVSCSDNFHTCVHSIKGWYVGYSESKKYWMVSVGFASVPRSGRECGHADIVVCCSFERKVRMPNQAPEPTLIAVTPRAGHESRQVRRCSSLTYGGTSSIG